MVRRIRTDQPCGSEPEYVVAVVVDHGGYGAQAAAPAVANIYNYLYANPIQPVQLPTATSQPSTTPPATIPPAGTLQRRRARPRARRHRRNSGEVLNHGDHAFPLVPLTTGEFDQFTYLSQDGPFLGRPGDRDATPPAELDEALVAQDVHGPQHGVLVHPEDGGDVLGQGQAVPGPGFAFGDGTADFGAT